MVSQGAPIEGVSKHMFRRLRHMSKGPSPDVSEVADLRALVSLRPIMPGFIPWTTSAMSPRAVHAILTEIVVNSRRSVIECGAGVSTIAVASVLELLGSGRVVSLEHDQGWADTVTGLIERAGISKDRYSIVLAPMASHTRALDGNNWYDTSQLDRSLRFDLLIVDGPEAWRPGTALARYPALPVLRPQMEDDFSVFLDDTSRAGELAIARRWRREFHLRIEDHSARGGFSLLRPDGASAYNVV